MSFLIADVAGISPDTLAFVALALQGGGVIAENNFFVDVIDASNINW